MKGAIGTADMKVEGKRFATFGLYGANDSRLLGFMAHRTRRRRTPLGFRLPQHSVFDHFRAWLPP